MLREKRWVVVEARLGPSLFELDLGLGVECVAPHLEKRRGKEKGEGEGRVRENERKEKEEENSALVRRGRRERIVNQALGKAFRSFLFRFSFPFSSVMISNSPLSFS